jgi:hypothetical protein
MFEWLEKELATIRTHRFHIIDGPAEPVLRSAINNTSLHFQKSYIEFVLRFGNAKLYRKSLWGYTIGIFAGPREIKLQDETLAYKIGFHDSATALFKKEPDSNEYSIYQSEPSGGYKFASDFEEWLSTAHVQAKNKYSEEEWSKIEQGPAPFSSKEQEIIEARRLMDWRLLGVDSYGNNIFEVTNAGRCILPVLTIGVRSKNGRLNGALRLKTQDVSPGKTLQIHMPCYKGIIPPEQIEVFSLPEPQPEDRIYFAEFRETDKAEL